MHTTETSPPPTYPTPGLVFGHRLDGSGRPGPSDPADLRERFRGHGSVWLHYALRPAQAQVLVDELGLMPAHAAALCVEGARPRMSIIGRARLVVLRGVNLNPGAEPEDMVSVRVWLEPDRVLTMAPRPAVAVQEVEQRFLDATGPRSPADVLVQVATRLVEGLQPVLDEIDEAIDELQARLAANTSLRGEIDSLQRELSRVRNEVILLHQHLVPQRDAVLRLYREPTDYFQEADVQQLREVADRTLRAVEAIEAVRERAKVVQDELNQRSTARLNRNTYWMSLVAAVFMPLHLFTGLLGMNVAGIPAAANPTAFWIVLGIIVVLGIAEVIALRWLRLF
jgi:zinc transporter